MIFNKNFLFAVFQLFAAITADMIGQNRLGNNVAAKRRAIFNSDSLQSDYIRFLMQHPEFFSQMNSFPIQQPVKRTNRMRFYSNRMLA